MSAKQPFTIEQFYEFVNEGKLMAAKCKKCGKTMLPPRPICTNCYSKDLQWTEIEGEGKLLTYTVIYVASKQFQPFVPYAVGIVELKNGLKLPGIIRDAQLEKLQVGMKLLVDFEKRLGKTAEQDSWPKWPRYYFKPALELKSKV